LKRILSLIGKFNRENIKVINNKKYRNEEHDSFLDVLRAFLADPDSQQKHPVVACLAVAGPVKNNQVNFTNRESWNLQGEAIAAAVNIKKVRLVNDFLAVGYGILTLNDETECILLQGAPKDTSAPIACIGAGTGLGECFLTPTGSAGGYVCFPSEGGHAEFAPRNDLEIELLAYLKNKFAQHHRISVERIVSGTGLANVKLPSSNHLFLITVQLFIRSTNSYPIDSPRK
jgi:glucokinase